MKNDATIYCRPEKLTCRWLEEITESVYNVCNPSSSYFSYLLLRSPSIIQCTKETSQDKLEEDWNKYKKDLKRPLNYYFCFKNKKVQDILQFKVDYNQFRDSKVEKTNKET